MSDFSSPPATDAGAPVDGDAVKRAVEVVCDRLLAGLGPDGFWEGRLSSSALSTATATSALSLAGAAADAPRIARGVAWLAQHANADGGWGDTSDSPSNLATTLLGLAALKLAATEATSSAAAAVALTRAEAYAARHSGGTPDGLAQAIQQEYGQDRTFAVPILMNCGLAGLVAWDGIPDLPFELAVFPHAWYKLLRLQVVSYALPALIAIGLLIDRRHPPRNFLRRLLRRLVTPRVLRKLQQIQPEHGGFLEATPLTSFVALGLIPLLGHDHPVAARCLAFLRQSQRADGSWPIDTNLSMWLTTAAVAALDSAGQLHRIDRPLTAGWIARQQLRARHPYTQAAPGGWAWTHLPGGVVDVDDTSGAIIALTALGHRECIPAGIRWLLDLQNRDGGWPTFCRGWGQLPFDKSAPDLTAHALRALCTAEAVPSPLSLGGRGAGGEGARRQAIRRGLDYLQRVAQPDGSWIPLWFGNQHVPGLTNPVLGTARVLRALEVLDRHGPPAARGVNYLLQAQNSDGGWGGAPTVYSSTEETALALSALAPWFTEPGPQTALRRGTHYLLRAVNQSLDHPAPIGLYFAHLWYSEQLYPLIWTLEALGRAAKQFEPNPLSPSPPVGC